MTALPVPSGLARLRATLTILATATVVVPASAQTPAPDPCTAFSWPVTDARTALGGTVPTVSSGVNAPQDFRLTLAPTADVPFPLAPQRLPKPDTFGGFVTHDPGGSTLQVTLSDEAWIDAVQDGRLVKSSSFSGQRGCAGVRKSVRFTLPGTGPVTVQVSGASARSLLIDLRAIP